MSTRHVTKRRGVGRLLSLAVGGATGREQAEGEWGEFGRTPSGGSSGSDGARRRAPDLSDLTLERTYSGSSSSDGAKRLHSKISGLAIFAVLLVCTPSAPR